MYSEITIEFFSERNLIEILTDNFLKGVSILNRHQQSKKRLNFMILATL
jgi:hypothetical protein